MLLLVSNLCISQVTDTQNNKCFNSVQVAEIYKGLKQGEYLKVLNKKTEAVLQEANSIIAQQKVSISKHEEILDGKNTVIKKMEAQIVQEKELCEAQKEQLQNTIRIIELQGKKEGRNKFWNGVKVGGVSVAILGTAAIFLLKK